MAQRTKVLAAKPKDLSSNLRTHRIEGEDSGKLSSDHHTGSVTPTLFLTNTIINGKNNQSKSIL